MTKAQRHEHKFGNAIRAVKGVLRRIPFGKQGNRYVDFKQLPQASASERVDRWAFRMAKRGQDIPRVTTFKFN